MAIIQTIRNRAGTLLAVIIGVSLFAFVLGDFITSGGFLYSKSKMNVAVLNGTSVSYPEFQKLLAGIEEVMKVEYQTNSLDEQMMEVARNQAWQELLQEHIFNEEYEKLGLAVSNPEFMDMIQGQNPHPMILRLFSNPETGTLDRLQLSEFINRIDEITGPNKTLWLFYERVIANQRLATKYSKLVEKGLYVNKQEAERRQKDMNISVDISYISKKYSEISDSSIVVKESEIKKYYKENIARYKQEESRDLKYVAFEILPSQADYKEAEKWINDIREDFVRVEDVEQYVNFTSPPYDRKNYKAGELPDSLNDFMFNAQLGDVYGPYFDGMAYKLAKLAKINSLPDSVHVSHILMPVNQNNVQQVRLVADSLVNLIKNGADFYTLVQQNSRDYSTLMSGGDMGWVREGDKGPYFSDSCFYSKTGDVKLTFSEEGLHIVKIMGQSKPVKKIQVGVLRREVTPGSQTDQLYYSKAVDFASRNNTLELFEEAVSKNDPAAIPAFNVKPLDNEIQGLPNSRKLVHWAFEEAKVGDINKEIENYGGKYIVAIVTGIHKKGSTPVEEVAENIKIELIKHKKAEIIASEMQKTLTGSKTIDQIGQEMKLQVLSANSIRFSSFTVPGTGAEPKLVAAAVNAEAEKITGPVEGENGVYLISVVNKEIREDQLGNTMLARSYMEKGYASRAARISMNTLIELGKITDQRGRFY